MLQETRSSPFCSDVCVARKGKDDAFMVTCDTSRALTPVLVLQTLSQVTEKGYLFPPLALCIGQHWVFYNNVFTGQKRSFIKAETILESAVLELFKLRCIALLGAFNVNLEINKF